MWLYGIGNFHNIPNIIQCLITFSDLGMKPFILDRSFSKVSQSNHKYKYSHIAIGKRPYRLRTIEFYLKMFYFGIKIKPSIIIASLPASGWIAFIVSRVLAIPFIYYPFEIYGEEYERLKKKRYPRFGVIAEKVLLRFCVDAFITQNKHRAQYYKAKRWLRLPPTIIQNFKPKNNVIGNGLIRDTLGLKSKDRIVLYEGDILQHGRNIVEMIKAVKWFPPNTVLVIMGKVEKYAKENILPLIEKSPYRGKVFIMKWVPHDNLLPVIADANVGLMSYENYGANNYYCAPGKISDYVNCGIPFVCPKFPPLKSILTEYNIGCYFEDTSPKSIAKGVNEVLSRSSLELEKSLKSAKKDLVWEAQEPKLKSLIMSL
tara:strand:+ start:19919 stop:21034 length:1116 start_codon:yes stop_codon:yes gene_type:complete